MRKLPDRGFTLVELVVTLVIIGALAAVSAPLFFSRQAFDQSGFYNETLSAVRYAQKHAVATGCTVRVNISATGYALFDDAPTCNNTNACTAGNYGSSVTHPADPGRAFAASAPAGIGLSPVDICFRPLGNTTNGVDVNVGVGTQQFTVWTATGYAQ